MIKTACCRKINLVVIKTHDLTNEWPFDELSNRCCPSAVHSAALHERSGTAAVEPGTAFDASMNSATAAASSASSAVKKALRLLRPALRLFIPLRCMNAQGPAVEPGTAFGCCIRCARQFLVCMPVIPYLYPLNCKHVE
jgi:hypothetical protein